MHLPNGVTIDPQMCPVCGTTDEFQEVGMRVAWQGMRLAADADGLTVEDWGEYRTGDDTDNAYIECRHCMHSWRSLEELAFVMKQTRLLTWIEERLQDALVALDRNVNTKESLYTLLAEKAPYQLDPRDLTRADPEPFVRHALSDVLATLEVVHVG